MNTHTHIIYIYVYIYIYCSFILYVIIYTIHTHTHIYIYIHTYIHIHKVDPAAAWLHLCQDHGRVYGVITAADAVRAFSEHLRGASCGRCRGPTMDSLW